MKITPLEIRQKTFEKKLRGYDKEEVDAFLMSLSQEWENLNTKNKEQKYKIESLEKDVEKLREVESSLFKTLKTAEDTGSHMVEQAKKDAELMLKEAHMDSEALMREARRQARSMIEDAEMIVKESLSGVKDQIKELEIEYNNIETLKENLLQDLQHAANDTLERVQKIKSKSPGFQSIKVPSADEIISNTSVDYSALEEIKKEEKAPAPVEEKTEEPKAKEEIKEAEPAPVEAKREIEFEIKKEEPKVEEEETKEAVSETKNEESEEKTEDSKKEGGSFFDMID